MKKNTNSSCIVRNIGVCICQRIKLHSGDIYIAINLYLVGGRCRKCRPLQQYLIQIQLRPQHKAL